MLKSFFSCSFVSSVPIKTTYEDVTIQTDEGVKTEQKVHSSITKKNKIVPFTNFDAGVLFRSGVNVKRVSSYVFYPNEDDAIAFSSRVENSIENDVK